MHNLEYIFKLQLFRALKGYSVNSYIESNSGSTEYLQMEVQLRRFDSDKIFSGMAEGRNTSEAKLRATAEAYERLCFDEFLQGSIMIDRERPYGIGVGLRRRSAKRRAYGEYYERRTFSKINVSVEDIHKVFSTDVGQVHVAGMIANNGNIGTGYGFNRKLAFESASRSAIRRIRFPEELRRFVIDVNEPKVFRITPTTEPWLECYLVGHVAK